MYLTPDEERTFRSLRSRICNINSPSPIVTFKDKSVIQFMKECENKVAQRLVKLIGYAFNQPLSKMTQALQLFPYFSLNSTCNDPKMLDNGPIQRGRLNISRSKNSYGTQSLTVLKNRHVFALLTKSEQSPSVLIDKLSNECYLNSDNDNNKFKEFLNNLKRRYGEVWVKNTRFLTGFVELRARLLRNLIEESSLGFNWSPNAPPEETIMQTHLVSEVITPIVQIFFPFYNLLKDGKTEITVKPGNILITAGHGSSKPDAPIYYCEEEQGSKTYKILSFCEFKRNWAFDRVQLNTDSEGLKYSQIDFSSECFGITKEGTDIMKYDSTVLLQSTSIFREICTYFLQYSVRFCILSCGIKNYLFKLDMNAMKEMKSTDFRNKKEADALFDKYKWENYEDYLESFINFAQHPEKFPITSTSIDEITSYDDVCMVPLTYSLFSAEDSITLNAAFASMLLELSSLEEKELHLTGEESELLFEYISKLDHETEDQDKTQNLEHVTKKPRTTKSNKSHKKSSRYEHKVLSGSTNDSVEINGDGFIGEVLQSNDISAAQLYLIDKQDFLKCFDYKGDTSLLPDKLVWKMYENHHVDYDQENTNREMAYEDGRISRYYTSEDCFEMETFALESLSYGIYTKGIKVPELYAYGYFQFQNKERMEKNVYPNELNGTFILMEYIEPSDEVTIKEIVKLPDDDETKMIYYNKALDQLNKFHEYKPYSILHNDIAKRNVLISKDKDLYILDFSEAIIFEEKDFTKDLKRLNKMFFPEKHK